MAANMLQLKTVVTPLQIFEQNEAVCLDKGASASKLPSMKNLANVVTDDCFNLVHLLFLCHTSACLFSLQFLFSAILDALMSYTEVTAQSQPTAALNFWN